ncbi:hypothetical protein BU16DRAFT_561242 [Lophium mytilinum]|uniref:Uncharacterized protein n=1 Tax=Lophium mytilinum TaxID=390894 RepID=A0A6A6QZ92_9PEZI|nr:hypothetical protein BU16DRAFT_561242 [Lophium mytilinum]
MPPKISFHLLPKPPLSTLDPTRWPALVQRAVNFRSLAHSTSPAEWEAQEERARMTQDRRKRLGLASWVFVAVEQPDQEEEKTEYGVGSKSQDEEGERNIIGNSGSSVRDDQPEAEEFPVSDDVGVDKGDAEVSKESPESDEAESTELLISEDGTLEHGVTGTPTLNPLADGFEAEGIHTLEGNEPDFSDAKSESTLQAEDREAQEPSLLADEGSGTRSTNDTLLPPQNDETDATELPTPEDEGLEQTDTEEADKSPESDQTIHFNFPASAHENLQPDSANSPQSSAPTETTEAEESPTPVKQEPETANRQATKPRLQVDDSEAATFLMDIDAEMEQAVLEASSSTIENDEAEADPEALDETENEELATSLRGEWIGTLNLVGPIRRRPRYGTNPFRGFGDDNREAYWEYEIASLFVLLGKRGQGVGRGLLRKAVDEGVGMCREKGQLKVRFSVAVPRVGKGRDVERLKEWFKRAGFERAHGDVRAEME